MKYLFAFLLLVSFSCSHKEKESDDVEWKEMDEFHTIMADVYHPLKDSNNLAPIKQKHAELASAADKWAKSKLPGKVDNSQTEEALSQLSEGCKDLSRMIKEGASDEAIASMLTGLHEHFHTLMESYYKADDEHGSEEHHEHH